MDGDVTGLRRPALADVLSTVVEGAREEFAAWLEMHAPTTLSVEHTITGTLGLFQRWPATGQLRAGRGWVMPAKITDVREAFEALITRGVIPESWAQDERRAFAVVTSAGSLPRTERHLDVPGTVPDLVAWASLGRAAITRAEEIAFHGAHLLTLRPSRVVWRIEATILAPPDVMVWQWERLRTKSGAGVSAPCDELYAMGLMWVSGDDHAVVLAVPPIGGSS